MSIQNAVPLAVADHEPVPRMGSEYADARSYLASAGKDHVPTVRAKQKKAKMHGSNDSDFGIPDQTQD